MWSDWTTAILTHCIHLLHIKPWLMIESFSTNLAPCQAIWARVILYLGLLYTIELSPLVVRTLLSQKWKIMQKSTASKTSAQELGALELLARTEHNRKVFIRIDKNTNLLNYQEFCTLKGFQDNATTVIKGETSSINQYPSLYCLIANCKMKPSSSLYYQVKNLHFDNTIVLLVKLHENTSRTWSLRTWRT